MKRFLNLFILVSFVCNIASPYGAQANILPYMPQPGARISQVLKFRALLLDVQDPFCDVLVVLASGGADHVFKHCELVCSELRNRWEGRHLNLECFLGATFELGAGSPCRRQRVHFGVVAVFGCPR